MDAWLEEILADAERKVEGSPPWMRSAEWRAEIEKIEERKTKEKTMNKSKTWFSVDCETDGPCPGLYSLVSVGIVRVDRDLRTRAKFLFAPLEGADWQPEALAVSGTSREAHLDYPPPSRETVDLAEWVYAHTLPGAAPCLVSDNPTFDGAFLSYYFHRFAGKNPFGHSGRRVGDLYAGLVKDAAEASGWKRLRRTPHDHDPENDAAGVAEAIIEMVDAMGLKVEGL